MSSEHLAPPEPQVVKQAIHWMLRLGNNRPHPRQQQQLDDWRAAHPSHELAWQRVQTLNQELTGQYRTVPGAGVALQTLESGSVQLSRRRALKLLGGLAMVGSAAWLGKDMTTWQQWTSDFATATGERRGFLLPDGSRLDLNTHSAANLHFDARQRLVSLQYGELMLNCVPDAQGRPLRVSNRDGAFESTQGRFVVRQQADCTRLSVSQGQVAILLAGRAAIQATAGQTWQVTPGAAQLAELPSMDMGAWADGLIVTRNMRLRDFLAEVARYRVGYLTCSDDIADLRLSGVFRLEDTDKLLQLLPHTLPVQLNYHTRWWARLQRQA
ncbi:MAG: FecR family protein [Pseudomonas sp.]|nr:FecR family protein [Pseudomonas sp.]